MQKLIAGLIALCITGSMWAQTATVKGTITDTLGKKNLSNAVVSLLQKSDSTLYQFKRSGTRGEFNFPEVKPGAYVLLVTYPRFADFADEVQIHEGENNLKTIPLTLAAQLLDAVVIRTGGAIRIKGDTTEFVADSFKLHEGATVEELLRRLPGFQVNSKGEVTAQGQRVQKVLVDGEEFFGDDPTVATRNIGARAVDKVQVYDAVNENQQLTGLSTGNEGKTVNIKLKEDAKKGSFGKAVLGSDTKLVDAKLLFNNFEGSKKISAYGTKSDVNTGALNWDDQRKLGMENYEVDEIDGGVIIMSSSGDEFNSWNLQGLPHAYSAGGLYNNKWNDGKSNLNSFYNYNRLETENEASTLTQNILPTQLSYRDRFQNSRGMNEQHAVGGKYEWKLDSLASFKFSTLAKRKSSRTASGTNSFFRNEGKELVNSSDQQLHNEVEKVQNDTKLIYTQLFRKKNRQLTTTLSYKYGDDNQDGVVETNSLFYKNNALDSSDVADQKKTLSSQSQTLGAKITYSEPLSLKWNLVLDFSFNQNKSFSYRNTYDAGIDGKYADLNELYSNNFDLDAQAHAGMAVLRLMDRKLKGAAGIGLSSVNQKLKNLDSNSRRSYSFLNFTPQANLTYNFKPQTMLTVRYNGTTTQPTLNQLQPLRENIDRLSITMGNPDLKVGFIHRFSLNYNSWKTLARQSFYISAGYTIPVNAVTMMNTLDMSRGLQTSKPVNVNGNRNWNFWGMFDQQGADKKPGYGLNLSGNGNRMINFVNGKENTTNSLYSNFGVRINFNSDKGRVSVGPGIGYNTSQSSLQPDFNNNYWIYGGNIFANWKFSWKLQLNTDCQIAYQQQLKGFSGNPNQIVWNATLSKEVVKNGKISLVANDILNQNRGFNRSISTNFITENRFQRVGQYFFLQFEWSFNTMPIK
ncbi:MAG: TonB-dependent receptor [Flavisolibacter sp.]